MYGHRWVLPLSVQFSPSVVSNSCDPMDCSMPDFPVHQLPGACSNSCPSRGWCHPTISSSVIPFSCLQSSPASESFPLSYLFTSGGQSIGALASHLPVNIQDWFPEGFTGLISLLSKGLSRVLRYHNSKVSILWHSAFFIVQLSHPYMTTGKTIALTRQTLLVK